MSEFQTVALVALLGALILATYNFRARELSLGKVAKLAAIWFGAFAIVFLFIRLISAS